MRRNRARLTKSRAGAPATDARLHGETCIVNFDKGYPKVRTDRYTARKT
jgi:hypothetical protein